MKHCLKFFTVLGGVPAYSLTILWNGACYLPEQKDEDVQGSRDQINATEGASALGSAPL